MIIYKYLNEEGALSTLKNNAVLLRTPLEFNDPFDSLFHVSEKEMDRAYDLFMNYQLFIKFYKELVIDGKKPTYLGKIIKENIKKDALVVKNKLLYRKKEYISRSYKMGLSALKKNDTDIKKQFSSLMKSTLDILRNTVLISCFGSTYDSILMWSHYANKHKGACIEFEIDDKDFRKVVYAKELPNFRFTDALEILFGHNFAGKEVDTSRPECQFILDPLFIKSVDWSYEGEVRCVYSKSNPDPKIYKVEDANGVKMLLKMPKIKKIYLGCNASNEFVNQINGIAGDIPVIKLMTCSDEYGLKE